MQIGDIVVLKSGSQEMTIESVRPDGRLVCVWTDLRMKVSRNTFLAATLRLRPSVR